MVESGIENPFFLVVREDAMEKEDRGLGEYRSRTPTSLRMPPCAEGAKNKGGFKQCHQQKVAVSYGAEMMGGMRGARRGGDRRVMM